MIRHYFILPNFSPIIFSIGCISLYWYGFMYLLSFLLLIFLLNKNIIWSKKDKEYLFYYLFIGVILGGKIGYFLFYNLQIFFKNPFCFIRIWNGGMSFHGGLIGVIIAIICFSNRTNIFIFEISDFLALFVPFCLGIGRLGNFINGELWGRVSTKIPWAICFPSSREEDKILIQNNTELKELFKFYGSLPRHPSQIYEILLEGLLLFFIIYIFNLKDRPIGSVSGLFLICYGLFRILIEFFRQPDIQLGFFAGCITMGQILSFPMIIIGIIIMFISYRFYYK